MEIKRCSSLWKCRDDSDNILTEVDGQFTQLGLGRLSASAQNLAALRWLAVTSRKIVGGCDPITDSRTRQICMLMKTMSNQFVLANSSTKKSMNALTLLGRFCLLGQ